ncbi:MAG TPA: ATP-dependent DNA ligase [Pseudomonadales bacterium]|nr:ATP-dependent DNA ligase [Pseudomonadales bacterium]
MTLPLAPPYPPMEARLVTDLPLGPAWQYEPKWDGFRCVAFRDGDRVELQSKSGQPLARYFPEVVTALRALKARRFVLDGELVVPKGAGLSFDALLQRIHPAPSRVERLSRESPAVLVVFDLLVDAEGRRLTDRPLRERRRRLEAFGRKHLADAAGLALSPASTDAAVARAWLSGAGGAVDGVIAKRLDLDYRSGDRTGMEKVKRARTADVVVGGFRYASGARVVGSLLLGLYDAQGLLHHVGFTSGFSATERKALLDRLRPLIAPPGFTGQAPGGPSRWSTDRSAEWEPLRPRLVAEIGYDHFTGGRFRHGTRFLRWRPDKAPRQCTLDQVHAGRQAGFPALLGRRVTPRAGARSRGGSAARRGG